VCECSLLVDDLSCDAPQACHRIGHLEHLAELRGALTATAQLTRPEGGRAGIDLYAGCYAMLG
jgi:hypothetical protein